MIEPGSQPVWSESALMYCNHLQTRHKAKQLSYLFMKIDCNCDGRVSWDELLHFVLSQNRNEHKPQLHESLLSKTEMPDIPPEETRKLF